MSIPQKILDEKKALITNEENFELIDELNAYNKNMERCRAVSKEAGKIKFWFLLLNAAMLFAYFLALGINSHPNKVHFVLLFIYLGAFVLFALLRQNFRVCACASLLLVPLELAALIFVAANLYISWYHYKLHEPLTREPDYPKFREIVINYQKHSKIRAKHNDSGEAVIEEINTSDIKEKLPSAEPERFDMPGLFDDLEEE